MKKFALEKLVDILFILLFLSLGFILLWNSDGVLHIHTRYGIPLGSVLSAYGLFKLYQWYHRYIH
jgi:hypothetical protein